MSLSDDTCLRIKSCRLMFDLCTNRSQILVWGRAFGTRVDMACPLQACCDAMLWLFPADDCIYIFGSIVKYRMGII